MRSNCTIRASQSVISGVGALCTYTRLVRASHVSGAIRASLSNLCEARPKVQVVVWLEGSWIDPLLSSFLYSQFFYCFFPSLYIRILLFSSLLLSSLYLICTSYIISSPSLEAPPFSPLFHFFTTFFPPLLLSFFSRISS